MEVRVVAEGKKERQNEVLVKVQQQQQQLLLFTLSSHHLPNPSPSLSFPSAGVRVHAHEACPGAASRSKAERCYAMKSARRGVWVRV